MGKLTIRPAGVPHVKRIVDGDTAVALIQQRANGWWGLHDLDDNRINAGKLYVSPAKAKAAFALAQAGAIESADQPADRTRP